MVFRNNSEEHADVTGGWLRPSVFGITDGLVSNFGLMAGAAGGAGVSGESATAVIIAGFAGMIAGAASMACGEFVSVASQRDQVHYEIEREKKTLRDTPEKEIEEYRKLWEERGISHDLAQQLSEEVMSMPELALEVHCQEELGITEETLPSATIAAFSSFLSFLVGAVIPILPYLLGSTSFIVSLYVTSIALFGVGALVSCFSPKSWFYMGIRQLLVGLMAAGVTWAIGNAIGQVIL